MQDILETLIIYKRLHNRKTPISYCIVLNINKVKKTLKLWNRKNCISCGSILDQFLLQNIAFWESGKNHLKAQYKT